MHNSIYLYGTALFAGGILPGAFAPHHLWPLAILSPALLLTLWQRPSLSAQKAFWLGWVYGIGMFGMGVSWVFVSIHQYGNTTLPIAVFITALFIFLLGLFTGAQGYILKKLFKGNTALFAFVGFPSSWVLFEWLRGWLFTGFPWLFLGYSQLDSTLKAYAPLCSVYGVSLAVALNSGALIALIKEKRPTKIFASGLLLALWAGGYLLQDHSYTSLESTPRTVSLIQGNIKPFDKFSQTDPIGTTEQVYGALTQHEWNVDLILWPESAVPLPLPYSQGYIAVLQKRAIFHHTTLITGIQSVNEQGEYYNSLIALGNGQGIYHKHHLLPFGDFLPLESWLRGLIGFFDLPMSSFSKGPKNQPLIKTNKFKLAPLICFEIAFPELVRETLRDADAIITLSEDGWFGSSWGPHQHLQIAQMRALETGRFLLRATTSGITAIITPNGSLEVVAPQFEATALKGTFFNAKGQTPWVKIGLWPLIALLFLGFLLPGRINLLSRR